MALFQNSVLKKYLAAQAHQPMHEAFAAYLTYFHNPRIRLNILAAKEEQFQEGFLRELFVKILGYTINPEPDYNLTTELKNIRDSKKTDGAILKDGNAIAVIELKGTDTKDLDKIRDQAFNYKNNQPECVYVITSNFEKLRFYIDNAVDYVEFNILAMESDQFKLMWLLLHKDNLLSGLPKKIKEESLIAEEQITKQLYRDYSAFKQELWQDMVAQNPAQDELVLYKKSQKLLDRFLFIFFAEDKGLLPPNSIMEIVNQWVKLKELDEYRPIYERFKKYFGYLNTGRMIPGKPEIHAYNGGLFAPDPILDELIISDALLEKHVRKLTEYDFESEVDTNILGHIFEHSLNDIENVRASLEGQEVDKSKTKRKRDGVFYTPKYITKYIVENTLGRLCTEKKAELELVDEEYSKFLHYKTKEAEKKRKTELKQKLDTYRNWLLQLTICDPACGSGAFLNQVLEFLIAEHRYVDELEAQLFDSPLVLPNVENHILENNIFGVDINEESVEIARLSLWLRTAKRGRKLSSLNSNIKVGNSLIDDPAVAGDLAFNWAEQFPQVFAKGGFDVVVGNPPYGAELSKNEKDWMKTNFKISEGVFDTFLFFFEKTYFLLKEKGLTGVITPNTFLVIENAKILRGFLFEKMKFEILLEVFNVFSDAVVEPIISILKKQIVEDDYSLKVKVIPRKINFLDDLNSFGTYSEFWKSEIYNNEKLIFNYRIREEEKVLLNKIYRNCQLFSDVVNIKAGVKPYEKGKGIPAQSSEILLKKPFTSYERKDNTWFPVVRGSDVKRYKLEKSGEFIKYGEWLAAPRSPNIFFEPKIFMRRTDDRLFSVLDVENMVGINSVHCIQLINDNSIEKLYSILALLNSKLIYWIFCIQNFHMINKPLAEVKVVFIERLAYKNPFNSNSLMNKATEISDRFKVLNQFENNFLNLLISKFDFIPSTKLQNWPDLDFKGFLGELSKAKVKLSLAEEAEWMAYFNEQKAKAQALHADITRLDREIDALVYELYGLTEEEIRIVENN